MITELDTRERVTGWANEYMVNVNGEVIRYDAILETKRANVTAEMPEAEIRALFPYKVRLKEACKLSGKPTGFVYEYGCVGSVPQAFPIKAMVFMEGSGARVWYNYNSQEAELIIPKDAKLIITGACS